MTDQANKCHLKNCNEPSVGYGARAAKVLCERHLAHDRQKVLELQKSVKKKLEPLKAHQDNLRVQQRALAAELQDAEELFESAIESIVKWKAATLSRLNSRHDAVLQKLNNLSILQEYETAAAEAEANNDINKVFELTIELDLEFEDCTNSSEFCDSAANKIQRSVGDVSGGLKDLKLLIDRQMSVVLKFCEPKGSQVKATNICEFHSKIEDLQGSPFLIVSCNNTSGFFSNSNGRVVKAETADNETRLPEPCLIAAFEQNDNQEIDYLLLCSLDGSERLKTFPNIDWSCRIAGLCCDSARQALYIAQSESVTVADLSGCVLISIHASSLNHTKLNIAGLATNKDKLFVLQRCDAYTSVLCIDKETSKLMSTIILSDIVFNSIVDECISVDSNSLVLTNWNAGKIYKFCIASSQLITSYPNDGNVPARPSEVLAHCSGLLFASECNNNAFHVFQNDGTVLQTVGEVGRKLQRPRGLAVIEGNPPLLAVCEKKSQAISIFKLELCLPM